MNKGNRIILKESQLRNIIRESVKKMLNEEWGGVVYGESEFDPYEECLESGQFDEERLDKALGDAPIFSVRFSGSLEIDKGDYYTPPYTDIVDREMNNDDGAVKYIESIEDEEIKNFLLRDFNGWCEDTLEDSDIYDLDEPYRYDEY